MNKEEIKFKIESQTSDGGTIDFDLIGMNGDVVIEIQSRGRTDVRVRHKDLLRVLKVLEAIVNSRRTA